MRPSALALAALLVASSAVAQVPVRGYVRGGVYVAPHFRSAPDGYRYNNYAYYRAPSYGYGYAGYGGFGQYTPYRDYTYGGPGAFYPATVGGAYPAVTYPATGGFNVGW